MSETVLSPWQSVYQTQKFNDILEEFGFSTDKRTTEDGQTIFFFGHDQLTAWEVAAETDCAEFELPENYAIYQLTQVAPYNEMDWSNDRSSYYTKIILSEPQPVDQDREFPSLYDKRFTRNLNKAKRAGLETAQAETTPQVKNAVNLFKPHPERRDSLDWEVFEGLATRLIETDVAEAYVVVEPQTGKLLGASIVLRNDRQANLRYYTAEREMGSGNWLHYSTIQALLGEKGLQLVDQSGISPPSEKDSALAGITAFKNQINGLVVEFKDITHGGK